MQPQQIPDVLLSLLNVPDLVILAVVLRQSDPWSPTRRTFASLARSLVSRCIAMAGSYFLARQPCAIEMACRADCAQCFFA